jgi:arsenate reductase
MADQVYNVLFICTGNSARSILAEKLLEHWGKGRFRTFSAGSHPNGKVNPYTIKTLKNLNISTAGLQSKSWDEFATKDAPALDFVFTVCDNAAGEVCPHWPGQPMTAHWGVEDPAAVKGTEAEIMTAFSKTANLLRNRIQLLTALPIASLDSMKIKIEIDKIGKLKE